MTDDVQIIVNAVATANAGADQTICASASPTALPLTGASVGGSATTGAWSIISGGGSLSSTSQTATPATVTYTPVANFSGTVVLRLTSNDPAGPCLALTDDVQIIVNPVANVNAGSDLTICTSSSPSAITLSGASFSGSATTAAWSVISGGGSLSSTAQTGTPATVTYTPPAYIPANGNYSIDVTLQLLTNDPAGPCPAVSDTRIISVNYLVGGTITGAQTICIDGDPSVIGN